MMRANLFFASFCTSLLLVQGCATVPAGVQGENAKKLEQLTDAYNETLAEGCITGTLVGAAVGAAAGGNWQGALIGAGSGLVAGCVAGNYVANIQKNYANQEARIQKVTADLKKENQNLTVMLPVAKQVVADDLNQIDSLTKAITSGKMTRADAAKQLKYMDSTTEDLQSTLTKAKGRLAESKMAIANNSNNVSPQELAIAKSELSKTESQVNQLGSELDKLVKARSLVQTG
jgi:hypothetical protein